MFQLAILMSYTISTPRQLHRSQITVSVARPGSVGQRQATMPVVLGEPEGTVEAEARLIRGDDLQITAGRPVLASPVEHGGPHQSAEPLAPPSGCDLDGRVPEVLFLSLIHI